MSVDKILSILNFSFPNFISANNSNNHTLKVSKVQTLSTVMKTMFAHVGTFML